MTLEVSLTRMNEINQELDNWLHKSRVSCKEVESIIGKLSFIANCVQAGRVFIARLLNTLSGLPQKGRHTLNNEFKKDIAWWKKFMKQFNGQSILWLHDTLQPDKVFSSDACLTGAGATCENEYFHVKFPLSITKKYHNIAHLEMWVIILCARLWTEHLTGKVIHLYCNNQACVDIINNGKTKDKLLQQLLRKLTMILSINQIWIKLIYIRSHKNILPDILSRWYNGSEARREL